METVIVVFIEEIEIIDNFSTVFLNIIVADRLSVTSSDHCPMLEYKMDKASLLALVV